MIFLGQVGFEPTTSAFLERCSTNRATGLSYISFAFVCIDLQLWHVWCDRGSAWRIWQDARTDAEGASVPLSLLAKVSTR